MFRGPLDLSSATIQTLPYYKIYQETININTTVARCPLPICPLLGWPIDSSTCVRICPHSVASNFIYIIQLATPGKWYRRLLYPTIRLKFEIHKMKRNDLKANNRKGEQFFLLLLNDLYLRMKKESGEIFDFTGYWMLVDCFVCSVYYFDIVQHLLYLQSLVQNNSETHITWPLFSKIEDDDDGFQWMPIRNHRYLERLRFASFFFFLPIPFELFVCFSNAHCHTRFGSLPAHNDPTINIFVFKSYAIWKLSFRFFPFFFLLSHKMFSISKEWKSFNHKCNVRKTIIIIFILKWRK